MKYLWVKTFVEGAAEKNLEFSETREYCEQVIQLCLRNVLYYFWFRVKAWFNLTYLILSIALLSFLLRQIFADFGSFFKFKMSGHFKLLKTFTELMNLFA